MSHTIWFPKPWGYPNHPKLDHDLVLKPAGTWGSPISEYQLFRYIEWCLVWIYHLWKYPSV